MILDNRVLRVQFGPRGQRESESESVRVRERERKKGREGGRNVLNEEIHQVSLR
jgi:hypothetical protein